MDDLLNKLYEKASKEDELLYTLTEQFIIGKELEKLNNDDLVSSVMQLSDSLTENFKTEQILMRFMKSGDLTKQERKDLEYVYRLLYSKEGIEI